MAKENMSPIKKWLPSFKKEGPRPFFPPLSPSEIRESRRLVSELSRLPKPQALTFLESFSRVCAWAIPTSIDNNRTPGRTWTVQEGESVSFPGNIPPRVCVHVLVGYSNWLLRKYQLPGFVEVEPGDVVLDCGAFVGGFSIGALGRGARVIAVEPSTDNFESVLENLEPWNRAKALNAALSNFDGVAEFNLSGSPVEHSLLEPDVESLSEPVRVRVARVDSIMNNEFPTLALSFAKIEAEGSEPEILESFGNLTPKKVAVDVSPERGGMSSFEDCSRILSDKGYRLRRRRNVLFGVAP